MAGDVAAVLAPLWLFFLIGTFAGVVAVVAAGAARKRRMVVSRLDRNRALHGEAPRARRADAHTNRWDGPSQTHKTSYTSNPLQENVGHSRSGTDGREVPRCTRHGLTTQQGRSTEGSENASAKVTTP